jgi:hypothetical protein
MSLTAFSVIPLMVNVLPLLVCPYAKIVAARNCEVLRIMKRASIIRET